MSTASFNDETDTSRYYASYVSKKRKNTKVEGSSAPKRQSRRIASQSSDLTVAITQLRLNSSLSSSYDLNINEADEKEKNWWLSKDSLGSLGVEEE
ncbi:9377_t:CDS:1, partial [Paraglomus occultum]